MRCISALAVLAATFFATSSVQAADHYKIDPAHSSITFSVRHLGLANVKGQFKEFTGTITLDGSKITEAAGTIQVQSIDTGVKQRDDHLRTADFFDATKHPAITFKTKKIETGKDGAATLIADFTMRGVTKELKLPVKLSGPAKDPWGKTRIGLEAKTKLNRKDYGINYHQALESGVLAVADEVELEINAEAVKETS
ncbi:MAG TPA: YceI family protein [Verrucomicrobiae bacterium]